MRIFFYFLLFPFLGSVEAQQVVKPAMRLTYRFTFYPDSTKTQLKKTDIMNLDIMSDSGSIFYSKDVYEKRALIKENENTLREMVNSGTFDANKIRKLGSTGVKEDVVKYYTSKILVFGVYAGSFIYYEEPVPVIDWKLEQDTSTINGFLCQKALCSYGGRNYIAWFSKLIEITDGPWKFSGLPGGIVKIYDTQNYFTYELTETSIPTEKVVLYLDKELHYTKVPKVKILKQMKSYYEDPLGTMQLSGITVTKPEGTVQKAPKYYNPQEKVQ